VQTQQLHHAFSLFVADLPNNYVEDFNLAAKNKQLEKLRAMVNSFPTENFFKIIKGQPKGTALHAACANGHDDVVEVLLTHASADVNMKNADRYTPLLLACMNNHARVVEVLMKRPELDINLSDQQGSTPLWWAAYKGHIEVIKKLVLAGEKLDLMKTSAYLREQVTPAEVARKVGKVEAADFIDRFKGSMDTKRKRKSSNVESISKIPRKDEDRETPTGISQTEGIIQFTGSH
jgi:ankyrin repeat protein